MSTKECSNVTKIVVETSHVKGGPCGGALERKKKNSRIFKSLKDGRTVYVKKSLLKPHSSTFDPTAWYVIQVRRHKEIDSCHVLNNTKEFTNGHTGQQYGVEAYAAVQEDEGNRLVIHGKIFVRVDEANRVDVLKQCPMLKGYVKDPSRSLTIHDFTDFARVPDKQIVALRQILEIAEGAVEYSEPFQVNDCVKFKRGILFKSETLKDLEGEIQMINGKKRATVILDKIGVFKFTLPISYLKKV